jgi:hypothetical protein
MGDIAEADPALQAQLNQLQQELEVTRASLNIGLWRIFGDALVWAITWMIPFDDHAANAPFCSRKEISQKKGAQVSAYY